VDWHSLSAGGFRKKKRTGPSSRPKKTTTITTLIEVGQNVTKTAGFKMTMCLPTPKLKPLMNQYRKALKGTDDHIWLVISNMFYFQPYSGK